MIRDIKINYGELKRLLYQLNRYRKALVQMSDSVVKIQNTLKKNKGFVITSLVEQSTEIGNEIKSIKGEVDSIYNIINQYVIDMTRIIAPVRESQMMQVDRNDIYWNKESINGLCDSVSSIPRRISTYGDCDFWPFDDEEEERARRRRNDEKLSQIQSLLSNSSKLFSTYQEQMNKLYKVVQKYENMDDTYSKKAKALKKDNTNFAEGLDDIGKGAKKVATDVVEGVVEGSVDLVKGLVDTVGGVLKYDGAFIATAYGEVTGTDIPDSWEKYYEEKSEMANAVIKDPSLIGEGIAQQVSDGVEEKGVAYSVGYAAPIVASFVVGDKGASKASNVGKVSKVTSKLDDVANAVSKTSKVDDVVNSVNKVSIADDVANGVNKASKVDDILNEGSKVADDVAKIPKSEIVKDVSKGGSKSVKFNNWETMKNSYKGTVTKFVRENKPKYSPDIKKWFENGGSIEIKTIDGKQIWTYTSSSGKSVNYINGYVKFPDEYLNPTIKSVDIKKFTGDRSKDIDKILDILEEDYGITEIPDGYIVHHDTNNGILQLVDKNIHKEFTHIGGHSIYK